MVQAHRVICPVQDKHVRIDLPPDFPDGAEVEVIVLPLPATPASQRDTDTADWLRELWACAPEFPDRPADLPPEPVEIP
jgi:hypothetical protein